MPEGDTIFRAARTLHRALAGKPVASFESALPALNRIHDGAIAVPALRDCYPRAETGNGRAADVLVPEVSGGGQSLIANP